MRCQAEVECWGGESVHWYGVGEGDPQFGPWFEALSSSHCGLRRPEIRVAVLQGTRKNLLDAPQAGGVPSTNVHKWPPRLRGPLSWNRSGSSLWVLGQRVGSEAHMSRSSLWVLGQRGGSETSSQVAELTVGAGPRGWAVRLTGRGAHCGCWAPRVGSEAHRSWSSLWVLGQRVGSEAGSWVREHIVGAWP